MLDTMEQENAAINENIMKCKMKNKIKMVCSRGPHFVGIMNKQIPVFDSNMLTCMSKKTAKMVINSTISLLHFCQDSCTLKGFFIHSSLSNVIIRTKASDTIIENKPIKPPNLQTGLFIQVDLIM